MPAGSVVITEKKYPSVQLITFAWTSDAAGNVNGLATTTNRYTGQAIFFATVPGASVSGYTIAIIDSNSLDLLATLTARSTTVTQYVTQSALGTQSSLGAVSDDVLTISVTGAGSIKTGTAYLWIR
jgi:hypothetical protein